MILNVHCFVFLVKNYGCLLKWVYKDYSAAPKYNRHLLNLIMTLHFPGCAITRGRNNILLN